MTKPVIVNRATKGLALTYTELDSNFSNLQNATINYTVGANTAQVDLNSALTFTAGTGISLSLNTSTKTLTVTSSAASNSISQLNSDITVTDAGTGQIDFTVDGTAVMQLKASGLTAYRETVYAGGNTSTAITPSYANGNIQTFTANNDFTLNLPTGMSAGQNLVLIIAQDATGTRLMTANSSLKFSNANKTLSITASAIDVISIFYDGSRYLCSLSRGFA